MNRGVLQSSPVQQMMAAGNPSWWPNINNLMRPPLVSPLHHHQQQQQQQLLSPNNNNNNNDNSVFQAHYTMSMPTPSASSSWIDDHNNNNDQQHHLPEPWSQLLLGGVCMGEQDQAKKMESWEEQVMLHQQQQQQQQQHHQHHPALTDVKHETSVIVDSYNNNNLNNNVYNHHNSCQDQDQFQLVAKVSNWSSNSMINSTNNTINLPASSPQSCVTTLISSNNNNNNNNSMLDFSSSCKSTSDHNTLHARLPSATPDRSSECNSTTNNGGALKKAKVQPSTSTQSTFKVRKEKLGDRITALHQLVSPFGKTDTASVLLEAIGYIRFLQNQIEALSLPYLSNGPGNKRQPHHVQGERNCIFPEDPGQLLNDNCLKRKGGPDQQGSYEEPKDLRSRGLCLVPVSCTLHVGSDNGADYWAPALGGGFR